MSVIRVNVTLPEDLLYRIDAFVVEHGMTRSGFLAFSARQYLDVAMSTPDMYKLMHVLSRLVPDDCVV